MIKKSTVLAQVVLAAVLLVQTNSVVVAQTANQVTNAIECKQGIADTNEAKTSNPELGPKAAKAFEEIMELAAKRCEQKEFPFAAELLNVARGMVASE
jgi:archaellin